MTYEEFIKKTKLIEDFFDKEYNYAQKEIMYEELKHYSAEKYEKAIHFICKTSRYKPILSEIIEAMQRSTNYSNIEREKCECKACKGTGYIIYHKKINDCDYQFVSLCNCKNAEGLEYDGTKIADKEHKSKYYIEKAENIFLNKTF